MEWSERVSLKRWHLSKDLKKMSEPCSSLVGGGVQAEEMTDAKALGQRHTL